MKKVLKIIAAALAVLIAAAGGYAGYVLLSYHRLGDMPLTVEGSAAGKPETGTEYALLSWNIGFGAYEADYSFFMDGGTQSWAWSEERLGRNLDAITAFVSGADAQLVLLQEVDLDATRTYHVDESRLLRSAFPEDAYDSVVCMNYDSPFLMYPLTQPHGRSKSALMTLSAWDASGASRVSLPVEESLMKLLDLDRCYCVVRIPVADGRDLVLYNAHLSAYTSDGSVATEQLRLLISDMQAEYERGSWCLAAGDFNKDLLGDSSVWFGKTDQTFSWAQPIDMTLFDGVDISLFAPLDEDNPVPSCRNADSPYHDGQYTLTVDGFMISPNISVESAAVLDTSFAYSDHNPVLIRFTLKDTSEKSA